MVQVLEGQPLGIIPRQIHTTPLPFIKAGFHPEVSAVNERDSYPKGAVYRRIQVMMPTGTHSFSQRPD
jgi:hypothetical protein